MLSEAALKELLQRYNSGSCTPEETALLEAWFDQVQQESNISSLLSAADEERLVQRLKENPRFGKAAPVVQHRANHGWLKRFARMSAAVWIAILLTISGFTIYLIVGNSKPGLAQETVAFLEVSTNSGGQGKFVLPDGSVVWLNSQSRLSYHPDFVHHREIRLEGEAFFEVTHDREHPFTVKAGEASTRVYGTAFNIQAYRQSKELRISLQHGSIGVRYDSSLVEAEQILAPGQMLIYQTIRREKRVITESPENMNAWVSGKLIFKEVPLKEVLAQLERKYKVTYRYSSSLKNVPVTARFDHPFLEKIMDHLSFGWDIEFERRGDTIYVK
jgi:transmembrane sensor